MKKINNLLKTLALSSALVLSASTQGQSLEKKEYSRIGIDFRNFNENETNESVKQMIGITGAWGLLIGRDFRSELNFTYAKKKLESKSIQNSELGIFFDYKPKDFYLGIAPKINCIQVKEKKEKNSLTGIGLAGRIGYNLNLGKALDMYLEINYSEINAKRDEEKINLGTTCFSIGLEF